MARFIVAAWFGLVAFSVAGGVILLVMHLRSIHEVSNWLIAPWVLVGVAVAAVAYRKVSL